MPMAKGSRLNLLKMIKQPLFLFLICCYISFGQSSYIEAGVNNTSYNFSADFSSDDFELDSSTGIFKSGTRRNYRKFKLWLFLPAI